MILASRRRRRGSLPRGDELGREVDGDHIMAICADTLVAQNKLRGGGFVATVMSNIGLHKYCEAEGLRLLCAPVGDGTCWS